MSKVLIIEDKNNIIEKFLSEIAKENNIPVETYEEHNTIKYKNIILNKDTYEVFRDNQQIFLTKLEFKILELLMENPKKVFSRNNILDSIWGYNYYGNTKIIYEHIKNIRRKLGYNFIEVVRGLGYKLEN